MSDDTTSRLRLITPPASEPITLSEAKLFLRIEHDADDALITRAISAAREAGEQYIRSAFLPQTLAFSCPVGCARLALPIGPATDIVSASITDSGGTSRTIVSTDYRLSSDGCQLLLLASHSGVAWTVTYTASLAASAGALSALIKQGMLHHISTLVEMREGLAPMPLASLQCYQPFRRIAL